jgi:hypothetical protein
MISGVAKPIVCLRNLGHRFYGHSEAPGSTRSRYPCYPPTSVLHGPPVASYEGSGPSYGATLVPTATDRSRTARVLKVKVIINKKVVIIHLFSIDSTSAMTTKDNLWIDENVTQNPLTLRSYVTCR